MNQNKKKLVSILIPTHNRDEFIVMAVRSALSQDYADIEVIVGVNGCSDNTLSKVNEIQDSRLKILSREKAISMYDNFNSLLDASNGQYVLMLSDDDILMNNAITKLVDAIECNPGSEVAIGAVGITYYRGAGKIPKFSPSTNSSSTCAIHHYLCGKISVYPCGTLIDRQALIEIGKYNNNQFGLAADVAAWMLVSNRNGIVSYCTDIVAQYMVHKKNETITSGIEKWRNALSGIEKVLRVIKYNNIDECESIKNNFTVYRAECIGRSQSVAISNGRISIKTITLGAELMITETKAISFGVRVKILFKWMARIIINKIKK